MNLYEHSQTAGKEICAGVLKTVFKETIFIAQTNHQQGCSKTKQMKVLSQKLDQRGRGRSRKGWGEQHVQGGPAPKYTEGYRSAQKQNIREDAFKKHP